MNYAYLSQICLDAQGQQPVYMQLRNAFRALITQGILAPNHKLPSSRMLSDHFGLHRQTVIAAFDALIAEGWLVSEARKGLFVNQKLPQLKPRSYGSSVKSYPAKAAFYFHTAVHHSPAPGPYRFGFDDGYPDIRIAPYKALSKAHTQTLMASAQRNTISRIARPGGSQLLREQLAHMMRQYRGMAINAEHVLLTHGSQMSIYLVANRLLSPGDQVVVTRPNYMTSDNCFIALGARLLYVGVDQQGMQVDELEALCKKKTIRFVYVTSHHHHPTTVTLSIERRLQLLQLAERYGFAIIEDDYDYDYHYENKPLLPIASNDKNGSVIYIGSFSKILSQAFRVGYIIGPQDFVQQLATYRKLVDRQGDPILEEALGQLLENNVIKNHIRKATQLYQERRDLSYSLLTEELGQYLHGQLPEGGLAHWMHFDRRISLEALSKACAAKGVYFPDGRSYTYDKSQMNASRMGFASMDTRELYQAMEVLQGELRKL